MRIVARTVLAAAAVLPLSLIAAAAPAAAQSWSSSGWTIRGAGVWVDPDFSFRDVNGGAVITLEADDAIGLGASAEYRFNDRFGLELGLLWAEPEVELQIEGLDFGPFPFPLPIPLPPLPDSFVARGDLRFTPLTAGLNYHLTPLQRVDVYFGPRIAYALYGDLELAATLFGVSSTDGIPTDDELGYGAGIGVDVEFGDGRWALHAAADRLDLDLTLGEGGGSASFDFDPTMVRAGLAYTF